MYVHFQWQEPKKEKPVIVAGKDVGEVDVDYFLIPVNIRDHEGPLRTSFPIENRLLPQGTVFSSSSSPYQYASAIKLCILKHCPQIIKIG